MMPQYGPQVDSIYEADTVQGERKFYEVTGVERDRMGFATSTTVRRVEQCLHRGEEFYARRGETIVFRGSLGGWHRTHRPGAVDVRDASHRYQSTSE